jgi:AraC-like DNA-binding protein
VEVSADSLLVTEGHRLSRYWCAGEEWVFCWYEFRVTGPLHFPLDTVMRVPPLPDEETRRDTIFAALRRDRFAERCRASAEFAALLYAWAVGWRGTTRTSPHAAAIAKAIDRMHETLEAPIGIAELAVGASMSERLFRDEFRIATGQAPKRFYEQLRLGLAHELLQLGIYTVSQVAARLGYSSPFHFSRTFKQRYGVAPSVIREQSG